MAQTQFHHSSFDPVTDLYEMSALVRMMHENTADQYPEFNYLWRSFESSLERSASCLDEALSESARLKQKLADLSEEPAEEQ